VRTMFDAITVADIPADATMVAGYIDGHYANLPEMQARFPHATVVSVTVTGGDADVLDIENGDATPQDAPGWIDAHPHGSLYCDESTWPAVQAAFGSRPLPPIWVAAYDGDPTVPAYAVAKQYASNSAYDTSSVSAYWPGVDPVPTPPEETMPLTAADASLVVKTLLNTPIWEDGDSPDTRTVGQLLEYMDEHNTGLDVAVAAVSTEVKALAAQVTALAAALAAAGHQPATAASS
jgi:hypothetical protein